MTNKTWPFTPAEYGSIQQADEDFALYRSLLAGTEYVLEIGSGVGRLTKQLLSMGCRVDCIELMPDMAEACRKNCASGRLEVFVQDMCGFATGREYDVVIIPANTITHAVEPHEISGLLSSCTAHLKSGGRLVIDVFNPDLDSLRTRHNTFPLASFTDPEDGQSVTVEATVRFDTVRQCQCYDMEFIRDGKPYKREYMEQRIFFPAELRTYCTLRGLRDITLHGDYQLGAFRQDSTKLILIVKK